MTGITKETFKNADQETKLDILFDYHSDTSRGIKNIEALLQKHPNNCEDRFIKLEKAKIKNTAISGAMGLIGGVGTMLAKLKFWG